MKTERDVSMLGLPTLAIISRMKKGDLTGKPKNAKKSAVSDALRIGVNQ
jgi:hypothetical protein